jgi:polar amino acid transport system substrate-binding protein
LLNKFHDNNINFVEDFQKALKDKNTDLSIRLAHTLKGVSGNIGANDLFKATRELEKCLKNKSIDKLESCLQNVSQKLSQILASIRKLKEEDKQNGAGTQKSEIRNIEEIKNRLDHLNKLLEAYDSAAGQSFMEIRDSLMFHGYDKEVEKMEDLLKNYNYDEAQEIVTEISNSCNIESK